MHPLFILACIINFLFWLYISRTNTLVTCPKIKTSLASSSSTADIKSELCPPSTHSCNPPSRDASGIDLSYYNTKYLLKYRDKLLGKLEYPEESLIVNPYAGTECIKTVQAQSSLQEDAYLVTDCMVVAFVSSQHSYNSIRFNAHWKLRRRLYSRNMEPGGFFKVPGHHNGRAQLVKKMGPFVEHILQIEDYIWFKLVERGLVSGDKDEKDASGHRVRNRGDLVVMVVNEGEMDLLANFACSCERFGVSMKNMLVFTPNAHLIPLIEALG